MFMFRAKSYNFGIYGTDNILRYVNIFFIKNPQREAHDDDHHHHLHHHGHILILFEM